MQLDQRNRAYLWDMLEAARTVREMCDGVVFHQYEQNRMLQLAVERSIEIIGEAARHVSAKVKSAHSDIPWGPIIAQRHILAHEYGEIKHERIWKVASVHLPELIATLEDFLLANAEPPPPEPPPT